MCGRIVLSVAPHVLAEIFFLDAVPETEPRFNVAPGQDIAAVVPNPHAAGNLTRFMRWGLEPPWTRGQAAGSRLINARSETVLTKPAFRDAFRHRRCLIPVDGFYEWQKRPGRSQPYLFRRKDRGVFALAGLWEPREQPGGRAFATCTILTTDGNKVMRPIHHRMPVILPPSDWKIWLGLPAEKAEDLQQLLQPAPDGLLLSHPVSPRVNKPEYDRPDCLDPVGMIAVIS